MAALRMRLRCWDLRDSRSASYPAMYRTAQPFRCSCCRCCCLWSSVCCDLSGGGRFEMRYRMANLGKEAAFYAAIAFFVILATFPFYWMLITSLKTNPDLYNVT